MYRLPFEARELVAGLLCLVPSQVYRQMLDSETRGSVTTS